MTARPPGWLVRTDRLRRLLERARTATRWDNRLWLQMVLDDMRRELDLLTRELAQKKGAGDAAPSARKEITP